MPQNGNQGKRGMASNFSQDRKAGCGRGGGQGGSGGGSGQGGGGRSRGGSGLGPQGLCVCPDCGTTVQHKLGSPCTSEKCPKCGTFMNRQR